MDNRPPGNLQGHLATVVSGKRGSATGIAGQREMTDEILGMATQRRGGNTCLMADSVLRDCWHARS